MDKELRKSFSEIKKMCDCPEKRQAYNKLVKTFSGKSMGKDYFIDLILTWRDKHDFNLDEVIHQFELKGFDKKLLNIVEDILMTDSKDYTNQDKVRSLPDHQLYNILKGLITLS